MPVLLQNPEGVLHRHTSVSEAITHGKGLRWGELAHLEASGLAEDQASKGAGTKRQTAFKSPEFCSIRGGKPSETFRQKSGDSYHEPH